MNRFWNEVTQKVITGVAMSMLSFIAYVGWRTFEIVHTADKDHATVVRLDSSFVARGTLIETLRTETIELRQLRQDDSARVDKQLAKIQKGIGEIKSAISQ